MIDLRLAKARIRVEEGNGEDVGGRRVKLVWAMGRMDGEERQSGFRRRTGVRTADGRANSVREQEIVDKGR